MKKATTNVVAWFEGTRGTGFARPLGASPATEG
jgi:hypothetical protein